MSTRSAPSALSAETLVCQPATASTRPLSRGIMSEPIGTMLTWLSGIWCRASMALSSTMPVACMPMRLPIMS